MEFTQFGKVQKYALRLLLLGSASYAFLAPLLVSASFFSIGNMLFAQSGDQDAHAPIFNSQTVPLLSAAANVDPNAAQGGGDIALLGGSALLAQGGPSGTAADIESSSAKSTSISVYTVHKGDTLSAIAAMFDVSVNTIMWANDLHSGTVREGQELIILPITGVRYAIQKGDTLSSIAKKYNADAGEIAKYNDLGVGASLAAGTPILIPDGEVAAPKAVAKAAPARSSAGFLSGAKPIKGGSSIVGYWVWPVAGGVVTQGLHGYNAIDIGAQTGTSIYASAAGTVIIARSGGWSGGYGNYLVIEHDNGTQTLYAHASKLYVSQGQKVSQGAVVAAVGSTGKATGPHLHFEIRGAANPFR